MGQAKQFRRQRQGPAERRESSSGHGVRPKQEQRMLDQNRRIGRDMSDESIWHPENLK